MIDHLGITVADFEPSEGFYDAMAPLGASLLSWRRRITGAEVGGYGRDRPCSGCRGIQSEGHGTSPSARSRPRSTLPCRARRRRQGQWRAGPAPALSPELLRRLRLRSRRQQCRGRLPCRSDHEPRHAVYRRLPVRRGALPVEGALGDASDLPLPHVPEGSSAISTRRWCRCARRGSNGRAASRSISSRPIIVAARLLRRLRHAADLRGARRHRRSPSALSTIRPSSRRPIQWGTEAEAALCRRHLRNCPAAIPWPTARRADSSPRSFPTSIPTTTRPTGRPTELQAMTDDLRTLYPEIEPFDTGMLDVGDGHHDLLGARRHQGRQAGGVPAWRAGRRHLAQAIGALFDPKLYDVILFDQRGCGKSTPQCLAGGQHDLASRRRHRAAARDGRLRHMAGVRRLLGLDAGARLCRDASRARQRTGACAASTR